MFCLLKKKNTKTLYHKACLPVAYRLQQACFALQNKQKPYKRVLQHCAQALMIHLVQYGISWDPVRDNGILWPCLSSGSRKHKSVSAHDRSRRYITYLWCTARNKTTELETSKQTTFMSITWCNRYKQSPKHRSILLPQPWSTHSSLSLEKRQYSLDFSEMLLFFKALTFLRGMLWFKHGVVREHKMLAVFSLVTSKRTFHLRTWLKGWPGI